MMDAFTFLSGGLPPASRVLGFQGVEALSELYQFNINLMVNGPLVDVDAITGEKATLVCSEQVEGGPFRIHGIIASVNVLHATEQATVVAVTLVPQLWQLTLTHHSRVFVDETIVDVIEAVLKDAGLSSEQYELKLSASYPAMEFVCQYQESNFAFISRWMEREGITYYFEQGEEQDKLIITDNRSYHGPLRATPVTYRPALGEDLYRQEAFGSFNCRSCMLPASVQLADYDYQKPSLDVRGNADISDKGYGQINVYGENFATPDEANRLAKVRAEGFQARSKIFEGIGRVWGLRSGYTFAVQHHPNPPFNTEYLATRIEHYANQASGSPELQGLLGGALDMLTQAGSSASSFCGNPLGGGMTQLGTAGAAAAGQQALSAVVGLASGSGGSDEYSVRVTAMPHEQQYRPPRQTRWPRIYGMENGVIDGAEDSPYAQLDGQGRYHVKINFDESDLDEGSASAWIRMLQPHGGGTEGFHFPLRKGTEVMLTFQGGDPDRPVISGVLPNAHKMSPVTKKNNRTNIIKTGGSNYIRLDDDDEGRRITFFSPESDSTISLGTPTEEDPKGNIFL